MPRYFLIVFVIALSLLLPSPVCRAQSEPYVGFDQNLYPGDALLPLLHKNLDYVGYWLNVPPGATANPWKGKRNVLVGNGFGFLILFNARTDADLKKRDPAATGQADAAQAIAAATHEGFPAHAIIFLDLEDGGRMVPRVGKYVSAWTDAIRKSNFRPGVYCSGIEVEDGSRTKISTADDVRAHEKDVALWVANDVCPPAPGCTVSKEGLRMEQSGRTDAIAWQYAQSPRRTEFTRGCMATYAHDGNCYAPGTPKTEKTLLDLNLSDSPDPSGGR